MADTVKRWMTAEGATTAILVFCAFLVSGIAVAGRLGWGRGGEAEMRDVKGLIALGQSRVRGSEEGDIEVVAVSDYQCPFCRQAHDTLSTLAKQYPGRLRLGIVHFPLTRIHPHAYRLAVGAECFAVHRQPDPFDSIAFAFGGDGGPAVVRRAAVLLPASARPAFVACSDGEQVRGEVEAHIQAARRAGVTGTPLFVLMGKALPLGTSAAELATMLRERLGGRGKSRFVG